MYLKSFKNPLNFSAAIAIFYSSFTLGLLNPPTVNLTKDSCLSFYYRATYYRNYNSLLRIIRNESDFLTSLAEFDSSVRNLWLRRSVNISRGELSLLFEFSPLHANVPGNSDGMYIDDVQLTEGYCENLGTTLILLNC